MTFVPFIIDNDRREDELLIFLKYRIFLFSFYVLI